MSKSPLSSKSVHHSSGNVQVSSKSTSKPQTLRLSENLRSLILKANRPSPPPPPPPPEVRKLAYMLILASIISSTSLSTGEGGGVHLP